MPRHRPNATSISEQRARASGAGEPHAFGHAAGEIALGEAQEHSTQFERAYGPAARAPRHRRRSRTASAVRPPVKSVSAANCENSVSNSALSCGSAGRRSGDAGVAALLVEQRAGARRRMEDRAEQQAEREHPAPTSTRSPRAGRAASPSAREARQGERERQPQQDAERTSCSQTESGTARPSDGSRRRRSPPARQCSSGSMQSPCRR